MTPADVRRARDWLPVVFECHVGGYAGRSYAVALDGDKVRYESFDYGYQPSERLAAQPDANHWRRFWATLDRLDAWSWSGEFVDPGVTDGTTWSIRIECDGRVLRAHGTNAYPPRGGDPKATPEFRRFCRAVERLVDGRSFR